MEEVTIQVTWDLLSKFLTVYGQTINRLDSGEFLTVTDLEYNEDGNYLDVVCQINQETMN